MCVLVTDGACCLRRVQCGGPVNGLEALMNLTAGRLLEAVGG